MNPGGPATVTDETAVTPTLRERIGALVPDHAYVRGGGPFGGKWQWTTPAGVWLVEAAFLLFDPRKITLTGGGATITLPATDAGFNALRAVMVALGAISDITDQDGTRAGHRPYCQREHMPKETPCQSGDAR